MEPQTNCKETVTLSDVSAGFGRHKIQIPLNGQNLKDITDIFSEFLIVVGGNLEQRSVPHNPYISVAFLNPEYGDRACLFHAGEFKCNGNQVIEITESNLLPGVFDMAAFALASELGYNF